MAGYFVSEAMQRNMTTTTKKRKDAAGHLDQVNDHFSDISLSSDSSPARKIRRLDAQLPPILEEDEIEFDRPQNSNTPMIKNLDNQERAIVPFSPVNNPILHNPSTVSVSLSPDIISGFKDQLVRSSYHYDMKSEAQVNENQCKAVVPWVPSQLPPMSSTEVSSQSEHGGEPMEDEEMSAAAMEIEVSSELDAAGAQETGSVYGGRFVQWQQQHCVIPQPPQNTSTPVTWLR